jgi:SiaC family regulatory phosphoprotein
MNNIKIVWCFQPDDENMEETGQEFSELVDIPFEFKNY